MLFRSSPATRTRDRSSPSRRRRSSPAAGGSNPARSADDPRALAPTSARTSPALRRHRGRCSSPRARRARGRPSYRAGSSRARLPCRTASGRRAARLLQGVLEIGVDACDVEVVAGTSAQAGAGGVEALMASASGVVWSTRRPTELQMRSLLPNLV